MHGGEERGWGEADQGEVGVCGSKQRALLGIGLVQGHRPKIFLANYDIDLGGAPAVSRGVLISEKKMKRRRMKR